MKTAIILTVLIAASVGVAPKPTAEENERTAVAKKRLEERRSEKAKAGDKPTALTDAEVGELKREVARLRAQVKRLKAELSKVIASAKLAAAAPPAADDEIIRKAVGMTRDDFAAFVAKNKFTPKTLSKDVDGEVVEWGPGAESSSGMIPLYTTTIVDGKIASIRKIQGRRGVEFEEVGGSRIGAGG